MGFRVWDLGCRVRDEMMVMMVMVMVMMVMVMIVVVCKSVAQVPRLCVPLYNIKLNDHAKSFQFYFFPCAQLMRT